MWHLDTAEPAVEQVRQYHDEIILFAFSITAALLQQGTHVSNRLGLNLALDRPMGYWTADRARNSLELAKTKL